MYIVIKIIWGFSKVSELFQLNPIAEVYYDFLANVKLT